MFLKLLTKIVQLTLTFKLKKHILWKMIIKY